MRPEQWQIDLQNCVRTLPQLEQYVSIENKDRMRDVIGNMRLSITPHTLGLINFQDPRDPILLMCVPQIAELDVVRGELEDPIGDEAYAPIPFLVHRYYDRVLIFVTYNCAQYCRFCFRRRKTGCASQRPLSNDRKRIVKYLRAHQEVEEAILTGGDPLMLVDSEIDEWLSALRSVASIRRIRIHTRVPVTLPSRVTDNLVATLVRHMDATHPICIVTQFNHPREIADANIAAIAKLADAGIVLRNQGPLLKGVNDNPDTLETLFRKLSDIRVTPYYLHHLDQARGISHFRVPIPRGIKVMEALRSRMSDIILPRYVVDLPGGKGKVELGSGPDNGLLV